HDPGGALREAGRRPDRARATELGGALARGGTPRDAEGEGRQRHPLGLRLSRARLPLRAPAPAVGADAPRWMRGADRRGPRDRLRLDDLVAPRRRWPRRQLVIPIDFLARLRLS